MGALIRIALTPRAARRMRLSAIEKIPDLLNTLSVEAVNTTNKIKGRLAEVKEVAEAVKKAAWGPPAAKKKAVIQIAAVSQVEK